MKSGCIGGTQLRSCKWVIPREAWEKMATNNRAVRLLRRSLKLTDHQEKVLLGTILGDGSLVGCYWNGKWKRGFRLKIQHSQSQKAYLFWKYRVFREWILKTPRYERKTKSWRFQTISHPVFALLRKEFYTDSGKKKLPSWIDVKLSEPLVLAVWFMDDGANMPRGGCILNTQNFAYLEVKYLQELFKRQHGLDVSVHRDKRGYRLYFLRASAKRFGKLIAPYITESMLYKLP